MNVSRLQETPREHLRITSIHNFTSIVGFAIQNVGCGVSLSMTRKIFSALAAITLLTPTAAAAAMLAGPTLCLPDVAKPGPQWWKSSAKPAAIELQFAAGATLGPAGAGFVAQARTLWDPNHQRALVRVDVQDVEALDPEDAFVFAVSDATGTRPELLVRFQPLAQCPGVAACDGHGAGLTESAIEYAHATGITSLTWTPLTHDPPMPNRTVTHPWIQTQQQDNGKFSWTLTFSIELPTVAGGEIAPKTRVYGSVVDRVHGVTSDTELEAAVLCESGSPTSDECALGGPGEIVLPGDLPAAVASSWPLVSSRC